MNRFIILFTFCKISDNIVLNQRLLLLLLSLTKLLLLKLLWRLWSWSYFFYVCCIIIMLLILITANNMGEYLFEFIYWFSWIFNTINAHINGFSYLCLMIWWFNNVMQNFKHNCFKTSSGESLSVFTFSVILDTPLDFVFCFFSMRFLICIWTALLNARYVCCWLLMNRYLGIFYVSLCLCRVLLSAVRMKNINICCHALT